MRIARPNVQKLSGIREGACRYIEVSKLLWSIVSGVHPRALLWLLTIHIQPLDYVEMA